MQRRLFLGSALGAALLTLGGCGGGESAVAAAPAASDAASATAIAALSTQLATIPASALSTTEADALVFMREEEKLARDVYQLLYAQWGQKVFSNIAASEQQHMDAVALLLTRYSLPDPAAGTAVGVFKDSALQQMFNTLMAQGQTSLVAALTVGATIEDLDIQDLQQRIATTDNADIALVFNELMKGSRNHLRAFISQLTNLGVTYTPRYITQAEFDAIVGSPWETGSI
ncbi:MAG: ferritin [Thiomonas sp. 20-64-5]|nr:MAG: ferritin [Thiomonas sp. 20-64-5]